MTSWLSVQKYSEISSIASSFLIILATLIERTAAASSSLGIDVYLVGVTLDFPITKL